MKKTDKGEWCHASCALWIPETAFDDVKLMEPIVNVEVRCHVPRENRVARRGANMWHGLQSPACHAASQLISEERRKLVCTLCHIADGACVQCCINTWCVSRGERRTGGPRNRRGRRSS